MDEVKIGGLSIAFERERCQGYARQDPGIKTCYFILGVGHEISREAPESFNAEVRNFLRAERGESGYHNS